MASRMPKGKDTVRTHVQMPRGWRRTVAKAAKLANVSISSFVAKAAHEKALEDLEEAAPSR